MTRVKTPHGPRWWRVNARCCRGRGRRLRRSRDRCCCRSSPCPSAPTLSLISGCVVVTLLTWTTTRGQGVCALHSTSCFVTVLSTSFVFVWCPSPNATKNRVMTIQSVKLFPPTDDHIACGSFRNRYRRKPRASPAALRDRLAMILSASVEGKAPPSSGNPRPSKGGTRASKCGLPDHRVEAWDPPRRVTAKHETRLARTTNPQLAKPTGLGENPPARVCWLTPEQGEFCRDCHPLARLQATGEKAPRGGEVHRPARRPPGRPWR